MVTAYKIPDLRVKSIKVITVEGSGVITQHVTRLKGSGN